MLTTRSISSILTALDEAGVRYLVAGGLAVIAHGHERLTSGCDLIIRLEDSNVRAAMEVFTRLGYRTRLPVELIDFADTANRRRWIEEKHMVAFPLMHSDVSSPGIDIFAEEHFDFEVEYARSALLPLEGTAGLRVISLETLLRMKKSAGRDKDLLDIAVLSKIHGLPHEP